MGKKIVYLLGSNYYPNGMSQIITQKINYLAQHTDYELYAILIEGKGMPMHYQLNHKVHIINFDINFDEIELGKISFYKKIYLYLFKIYKYKKGLSNFLINLKADIVVSVMRRDINFLNDIKDGSQKIGEIHFCKNNYREFNKSYLPKWFNRYITKIWRNQLIKEIKRLKAFVVLSYEDKKSWTELNEVKVIHNFIKDIPSESSTVSSKEVIAAGRYSPEKGYDKLIKAWEFVHIKHPDWKLNIYGSGNYQEFQTIANKAKVDNTITCHPATNQLTDKFKESAIFVLSSQHEGFGLVIVEAMSCGLPAVSFACPCGPKEIITDSKNGYLVEPNNTEALAERICYLIENEEVRKEMGKAARKRAEDFTEEKIMKQWVDLFENIQS